MPRGVAFTALLFSPASTPAVLCRLPAPPPPPPPFTCPQEPAWKPDAYEAEAEAPEKDAAWVEARGAEELEEGEDEPALADDRFLAEYRCAVGVWLAG